MQEKLDFYISYSEEDVGWATWIASILEKEGYTTRLRAWDFLPGSNYIHNIHEALIQCKRFLPVLSSHYMKSVINTAEWTAAFSKDPTLEKAVFLPVKIEKIDMSGVFAPVVCVELTGLDKHDAKQDLIRSVKGKRPRNAPSFPGTFTSILKPGQLPFNNIIHHKNPYFTGRTELIDEIRKNFVNESYVSIVQSVSGLGGVGKTQTALEFIFRFGYQYNCIWWIDAENVFTVKAAFRRFAEAVGIVNESENDETIILNAVHYWMQKNTNWLYVFDNAESLDSLIGFFPSYHSGHILITSRYAYWTRLGPAMKLDVFSDVEAKMFIESRVSKDIDKTGSDILAEKLGYLPLALEQACAFICVHNDSVNDYLVLLNEQEHILLSNASLLVDYPAPVYITWNISMKCIASKAAKELIYICAFFAPEPIDIDLFVRCKEVLPKALKKDLKEGKSGAYRVLGELTKYSLVERRKTQISIHRLLRNVIQRSISFKLWLPYSVQIISRSLEFDNYSTYRWLEYDTLLLHAEAVTSQAFEKELYTVDLSETLFKVGKFCHYFSQTKMALTSFMREKIVLSHLNSDIDYTLLCKNNIATSHQKLGDYEIALKLFIDLVDEAENTLEKNSLTLAEIYHDYAALLQKIKKYELATEFYQLALNIRKAELGDLDVVTAADYNNLSAVYYFLEEYEDAEKYCKKGIDAKESLPTDHPLRALSYNNYAMIQYALGNVDVSDEYMDKALRIKEKNLGKNNISVANTYVNRGLICYRRGKHSKALDMYIKSLIIYSKHVEHSDANMQRLMDALGEYHKEQSVPNPFDEWLALLIERKEKENN